VLGLVFKTSVRYFVVQVGSTPTSFRQPCYVRFLLFLVAAAFVSLCAASFAAIHFGGRPRRFPSPCVSLSKT
jgi:hypothetical protein